MASSRSTDDIRSAIVESHNEVAAAQRWLSPIGIDRLAAATGCPNVVAPGRRRSSYPLLTFADVDGALSEGEVIFDTRCDDERAAGHIVGSTHIPLHEMLARLDEVPDGRLSVHCASGFHARDGASLFDRAGRDMVLIADDYRNATKTGFSHQLTQTDAGVGLQRPARHDSAHHSGLQGGGNMTSEKTRHQILIVGGGTAGITVAACLRRAGVDDIAVIDPATRHYYQPLWTLVGGGRAPIEQSGRPEALVIPKGVDWIRERAQHIDAGQQTGTTNDGEHAYDHLVVCPGIQLDWNKIPGTIDTLATPHVSSNYTAELAPKTWEMIRALRSGAAVFTMPVGPIKCAGAPQKIAYLAADY